MNIIYRNVQNYLTLSADNYNAVYTSKFEGFMAHKHSRYYSSRALNCHGQMGDLRATVDTQMGAKINFNKMQVAIFLIRFLSLHISYQFQLRN